MFQERHCDIRGLPCAAWMAARQGECGWVSREAAAKVQAIQVEADCGLEGWYCFSLRQRKKEM